MIILHTSDLHIGSPLTSRLDGERARTRRREISDSLRRVTEAAKKNSACAVIIAGDLFDTDAVSERELDSVLRDIRAADLSFYYLPGNHEKNVLKSSSLKLPDNLFIFDEDWTYFEVGDTVIAGRSLTDKNMFDSLRLNPSLKNIVVLHGEARAKSETGGAIGIKEAADRGISYLALGHYHSYSHFPVDALGVAVYSGTPEGRGFDECGECGAVIIDTDSPYPYHRFIKTASRTLHSLEVSLDGAASGADIESAVKGAVEGIPKSDIVRISLVGRVERGAWIDTEGLAEMLSRRLFYAEVYDKTGIRISENDFANDSGIRGELVRSVLADGSLTDKEKEKIIVCALAALDGESYFGE